MKERPILFNGEMVRAILEGRKTQTRRPVKFPAKTGAFVIFDNWPYVSDDGESALCADGCEHPMQSPFGQPGDRMWVREKTRIAMYHRNMNDAVFRYEADGSLSQWMKYPARLKAPVIGKCIANGCHREASRITLAVKRVWVERLYEIDDPLTEGIPVSYTDGQEMMIHQVNGVTTDHALSAFLMVWDSIYGNSSANPWVWACEFERA